MIMKRHTPAIAAFLLLLPALANATPQTITFTEIDLTNATLLTTQYGAFGVAFGDNTWYAIDPRFPGGDDRGITTTWGSVDLMTVLFATPSSFVTFDWVTLGPDFNAQAFDSLDNLIASFSLPAPGFETSGTHTLSGSSPISRVIFFNGGTIGFIGVGTLTFDSVPEPSGIFLMLSGALALFITRRHVRKS